jgi:uncharacterized protein (TIGR03435 family)
MRESFSIEKGETVRIKMQQLAEILSFGRKLLLAIAAVAIAGFLVVNLLCAPQIRAQSAQPAAASAPSFEVASIKPNHPEGGLQRIMLRFAPDGLTASGMTVKNLVGFAYNLKDFQISGGPGWIDSERYDIDAKMDESTIEALKKLPPEQAQEQRRLMMQSLLAERFKLKVTQSSKELPIYALVVAKNGPKLTQSAATSPSGPVSPGPVSGPAGSVPRSMMGFRNGEITATAVPLRLFADRISREVGRDVVDKTGLQGNYDFTLHWTPEFQSAVPKGPADSNQGPASPPPDSGPSIFTALQEQLGLKLESQKGPVKTLVIESVEKPSEN